MSKEKFHSYKGVQDDFEREYQNESNRIKLQITRKTTFPMNFRTSSSDSAVLEEEKISNRKSHKYD
jgi:hypothetical protein